MAGGTFVTQNKVRPGVYINFVSEPSSLGTLGDRGTTALALSLSWGAPKQVLTIQAGEDTRNVLGYDITAPELVLIREALKRARTLLLYRLNTGTKASVQVEDLIATARYGGVRGNDIAIVVEENVDNGDLFDVVTLLNRVEMDRQTVESVEDLVDNDWVLFTDDGDGELAETAGAPLTGGADGTVTNGDHADYLEAIELFSFNTLAYTGTDATLKGVYTAFAQRLREDEGKKIQVVMENYPGADYEGVISVKNGVILADGTVLTAAQAAAWVAGATAGAAVNQSLTYTSYDGAVDVTPRYTNSQITAALQAGEFLFTPGTGVAQVEQDINSLTTFLPGEKGKQFAKNRVVRVLDSIGNDIRDIFESFYIGKVNNNADGRNLLKSEINNYLESLQNINAIQNFDSQSDVTVSAGQETDSVYIEVNIQPVDSVEKIYMLVRVR